MIKFLLIRNVAAPERERGNAGFDFFVPEFDDKFIEDCNKEAEKNPNAAVKITTDKYGKQCIRVSPHARVNIPSGVKSYISLGLPLSSYGLEADLYVENKSGVATKKGLDSAAVEVDPNYQGEIHLSLTNTTDDFIDIYPGDKIVQLVPRVYMSEEASVYKESEISSEDFWKDFKYNNRGEGWAGSTGTKAKNN